MRTTIDLPESLHSIAMGLARHTGRSLSQTIVDLVERGLAAPAHAADAGLPAPGLLTHPVTGLPVTRSRRLVTPQDVAELEDEV
jgi:hypothetical protein